MPNPLEKIFLLLKEVGAASLFYLTLYRLGLMSGYYRWRTPAGGRLLKNLPALRLDVFVLPRPEQITQWDERRAGGRGEEAQEILSGRVRLFGGSSQPLNLTPPHPNLHWSRLNERGVEGDIKNLWEAARFGWVFVLGRAYRQTSDESYPLAFWNYWEEFQRKNPLNCGENWLSAQEAALRLIGLAFAGQVFAGSPHSTPERMEGLACAVVEHARRIEPTLAYARAQNNNHLLSEAVGLILAAHLLPEWREAPRWHRRGWKWFLWAVRHQIEEDGEYIQHSTCYHRLMLTLALLTARMAQLEGRSLPQDINEKLGRAVGWLEGVMDTLSGQVLNLGHNDGTNLLSFGGGVEDYRPVLQAAAAAFLGVRVLPSGPWDELSTWLGLASSVLEQATLHMSLNGVQRRGEKGEWASLRAKRYRSRPAHADQLQVELWHGGRRLVCDAGTYAYNLPPPWDNRLSLAGVHNAPVIDGRQPMLRAGKFLWLRWDQAWFVAEGGRETAHISAVRQGYSGLGIRQERRLEWHGEGRWRVVDRLLPHRAHLPLMPVSLNWLLADGRWRVNGQQIEVDYEGVCLRLKVDCQSGQPLRVRVVRGGQLVFGEGEEEITPLLGWFSPTYLQRIPAISFLLDGEVSFPCELHSQFEIVIK